MHNARALKRTRFLLAIFILSVLAAGCFHVETPHKGVVKDADTQETLKGAVVLLDLAYTCYFPPNPGGPNPNDLATLEALTDINGAFSLPSKFSFLPPLACFTNSKHMIFFKPGYFPTHTPFVTEDIGLYKMDYYLNYQPYMSPLGHPDNFCFDRDSSSMRTALEKARNMHLTRVGDIGLFLRLEGKLFRQIYAIIDRHFYGENAGFSNHVTLYACDEVSGKWYAFDGRGKPMTLRAADYPKWTYVDSGQYAGLKPIYADAASVFYAASENDSPIDESGVIKDRNEIKFHYIAPHEGSILGLAGDTSDFATIEGNGLSLCLYGELAQERIGPSTPHGRIIPHFLKCFKGEDMPNSEQRGAAESVQFRYIRQILHYGYFVVSKTPGSWHVYYLRNAHKINEKDLVEELISFPSSREITAFAAGETPPVVGGGKLVVIDFYIAFKNEGIRKYKYNVFHDKNVKEDPSFIQNSRTANYPDVTSLAIGSAVDSSAVYAVTADNRIYRFSVQGIPDYMVELEQAR